MGKDQIHETPELTADQQADLMRRAKAAWAATGEPGTPTAASGCRIVEGLAYVVLTARAGTLAVYRIRPDHLLLRRMKRWPADVAPR